MRQITKDIQIMIDGSPQGVRLTKPDAFSGVEILRLLLRLQEQWESAERNVRDGSAVPAEHGTGKTVPLFPLSAALPSGNMTQNNQNVSAPVTINVNASGSNAEKIGQTIYNTAERYLLRTMKGAFS